MPFEATKPGVRNQIKEGLTTFGGTYFKLLLKQQKHFRYQGQDQPGGSAAQPV